jgi:ER membrane protein complex subunit 3
MQDQMSGAAMTMPQDPKAAFKSEWEALEITEYQNALQNVEADLLAQIAAETSNSIYH